jgi:D-alanyl-D-alanine carboxypeptidase
VSDLTLGCWQVWTVLSRLQPPRCPSVAFGLKVSLCIWMTLVLGPAFGRAEEPTRATKFEHLGSERLANAEAARRLKAAYPDHVDGVAGSELIWRDGTRLLIDDAKGAKPAADWMASPDIKDIFRFPYPAGAPAAPPAPNVDPGRARPAAFFNKMYGDCRKGEVARHLVDVAWLPSRGRQNVKATTINGVAQKLAAVSAELDALPATLTKFLVPAAGTYNCRTIAGTEQTSAHGYGIAIDIAIKHAHYWRWSKPDAAGAPAWRNAVPPEIVRIFEKHGFIWGGRWSHFDTMHFEYRPELFVLQ